MNEDKILSDSIEGMHNRIGPALERIMPANIRREIMGLLEDTLKYGFEQGKTTGRLEGLKEGAKMVMDNVAKMVMTKHD